MAGEVLGRKEVRGENLIIKGMDKPIPGVKFRKRKRLFLIILSLFVVATLLLSLLKYNEAYPVVESDKVLIEEVSEGIFADYAAVIGTVVPAEIIHIGAVESGKVEEIFVNEGTQLKKGEPLLRLSSEKLEQEISRFQTEYEVAKNELSNMKINLQAVELNDLSQRINLQYELKNLERIFHKNESLFRENLMNEDDFQNSRENLEKQKKLLELLNQKIYRDSLSKFDKVRNMEESVASLQKNLEIQKKRLQHLTITSPTTGELTLIMPEIGKIISSGSEIAKIQLLDSLVLEAEIEDEYFNRLDFQTTAFAETGHERFPLRIEKLFPESNDGQHKVTFRFSGKQPQNLEIGRNLKIQLILGNPRTSLLLPRGAFFQKTGGHWVFVLDKNRQFASRKNIVLGRRNPEFFEVLNGLEKGDKVIVSSYTYFENAKKIKIK